MILKYTRCLMLSASAELSVGWKVYLRWWRMSLGRWLMPFSLVQVGLLQDGGAGSDGGFWKFIIPISYLYHPLFKDLLEATQESTLNINSKYKCKLLDWTGKKEIVAEVRWSSSDPKKLVHDIPLGPNAMKVWVDISKKSDAFLWRPTPDMICIEDAIGTTITWPAERVVLETNQQFDEYHDNTSPSSVHTKSKNKCKLLDFNGSGKVVAEGRWTSSDPNQVVHFVPLGPNAMRVWVDIPRIPDASLWRPACEMDCIEEAIGSMVAWPTDKVIMF